MRHIKKTISNKCKQYTLLITENNRHHKKIAHNKHYKNKCIGHLSTFPDVQLLTGQTFYDLPTHLYLLYRIFHAIRINKCNFSCMQCNFGHILSYKTIFGRNLRIPSFCYAVGTKRPTFSFEKNRYQLDLGFKIGPNEKLNNCKET